MSSQRKLSLHSLNERVFNYINKKEKVHTLSMAGIKLFGIFIPIVASTNSSFIKSTSSSSFYRTNFEEVYKTSGPS